MSPEPRLGYVGSPMKANLPHDIFDFASRSERTMSGSFFEPRGFTF
jgi:hypothetical protein